MAQLKRVWKAFGAGVTMSVVGGLAIHLVDEFNGEKLHNAAVQFEEEYVYPASEEKLGAFAESLQKKPGTSLDFLLFGLLVPIGGYKYDRWVQKMKKNDPSEPKP